MHDMKAPDLKDGLSTLKVYADEPEETIIDSIRRLVPGELNINMEPPSIMRWAW